MSGNADIGDLCRCCCDEFARRWKMSIGSSGSWVSRLMRTKFALQSWRVVSIDEDRLY